MTFNSTAAAIPRDVVPVTQKKAVDLQWIYLEVTFE